MITLDRVRGIEGMKDKDRGKGGEIEWEVRERWIGE